MQKKWLHKLFDNFSHIPRFWCFFLSRQVESPQSWRRPSLAAGFSASYYINYPFGKDRTIGNVWSFWGFPSSSAWSSCMKFGCWYIMLPPSLVVVCLLEKITEHLFNANMSCFHEFFLPHLLVDMQRRTRTHPFFSSAPSNVSWVYHGVPMGLIVSHHMWWWRYWHFHVVIWRTAMDDGWW